MIISTKEEGNYSVDNYECRENEDKERFGQLSRTVSEKCKSNETRNPAKNLVRFHLDLITVVEALEFSFI